MIDPLPISDDTVYDVRVTNLGPSAAESMVVTDAMPTSQVSYRSHTLPADATCGTVPAVGSGGGTLECTFPVILAGQTRTILVTGRGVAKGTGLNSPSVVSAETGLGFEPNAGNNSSTEQTTVRTRTDVQVVSKVATPATVNLHDSLYWLITVHNNTGSGLAETDDVTLSDSLPANMELAGAPTAVVTNGTTTANSCTGAAGGTSFSCTFGTLSSDGNAEITVPVRVLAVASAGQSFTNSASVVTSSLDTVPGNNSNSGPVVVNSSCLAGTVFRDFANDGGVTLGDTGINAITMTLTGTAFDGTPITRTVTTNGSGNYGFGLLPQSNATGYTITQGTITETYLTNGATAAGTAFGTVVPTVISGIVLGPATAATGYLLPKIPQVRIAIAKALQSGPTVNPDGTIGVTFRLNVRNLSLEGLTAVVVSDTLDGAAPLFGSYTNDPTVALLQPAPGIRLDKRLVSTTDVNGSGFVDLGDILNYAFDVTNTGNLALADVTISDPLAVMSGGPISLAVGETNSTAFTASYTVTPADILRTHVENTATVTGDAVTSAGVPILDGGGNPVQVTDISDTGTNPDGSAVTNPEGTETPDGSGSTDGDPTNDPTVVQVGQPAIQLVITIADIPDINGNGIIDAGDQVVYTFTVTNTGDLDLQDVNLDLSTLTLPLPGLTCTTISLAVGETATLVCTGNSYTITPADVVAGTVTLGGTATGESLVGQVVTDDDAVVSPTFGLGGLTITKVVDRSQVSVGDVVSYTITLGNTSTTQTTVTNVVDVLPVGFIYQSGTATVAGVATEPVIGGRTLTWPGVSLAPGASVSVVLDVLVGASAGPGEHDNVARGVSPFTGPPVTPDAIATVRLAAEPVFACATIIGRVFDDLNQDGYFNGEPKENRAAITDQTYNGGKWGAPEPKGPEKGLPGVRLVAPNGVAITTDEHGRYSVPCAALPAAIGSNFMLKLDTRTLPSGYRVTTENPRVVRVTPGMLTKMNFGATISRVVRIDLSERAFGSGNEARQPRVELEAGLKKLVAEIADTPTVLRLSYQLAKGESEKLARQRMRAVEKILRRLWPANGRYQLNVETVIQRRTTKAVNE